jgi:hypothetical protein
LKKLSFTYFKILLMTEKNEEAAMTMERCCCEIHGWEMERLQLFTLASSENNGHNLSLMNEEIYNKNFRHIDCRWHNSRLYMSCLSKLLLRRKRVLKLKLRQRVLSKLYLRHGKIRSYNFDNFCRRSYNCSKMGYRGGFCYSETETFFNNRMIRRRARSYP